MYLLIHSPVRNTWPAKTPYHLPQPNAQVRFLVWNILVNECTARKKKNIRCLNKYNLLL